jgi:hypothetical protein
VIWAIVIALVFFLVPIVLGIVYLARNRAVLAEALRKRAPRKYEPVTLDRSPDKPHSPGATS